MTAEQTWLAVGMTGNALFFSRWLVQWVASERAGRSVVPRAFWYFSLLGSFTLLAYALYRGDPVFIVSQLPNSIIYLRNLHLIAREGRTGDGG